MYGEHLLAQPEMLLSSARKSRATIHELRMLPDQLYMLEDRQRALKADCIRLTLLLYLAVATTRVSHRSAKLNVKRLQATLLRIQRSWQTGDEDGETLSGPHNENDFLLCVLATGHYYASDKA